MIVKEKYEKYPKIHYPMIDIEEINNSEVTRFTNDSGECVSYLAYQFSISASQNETYTAMQNVDRIANIIDKYMKQDRYWCLKRIGSLVRKPLASDNNIIVGYLRYDCNLDLKTNTIYRRF